MKILRASPVFNLINQLPKQGAKLHLFVSFLHYSVLDLLFFLPAVVHLDDRSIHRVIKMIWINQILILPVYQTDCSLPPHLVAVAFGSFETTHGASPVVGSLTQPLCFALYSFLFLFLFFFVFAFFVFVFVLYFACICFSSSLIFFFAFFGLCLCMYYIIACIF